MIPLDFIRHFIGKQVSIIDRDERITEDLLASITLDEDGIWVMLGSGIEFELDNIKQIECGGAVLEAVL